MSDFSESALLDESGTSSYASEGTKWPAGVLIVGGPSPSNAGMREPVSRFQKPICLRAPCLPMRAILSSLFGTGTSTYRHQFANRKELGVMHFSPAPQSTHLCSCLGVLLELN
jgi:hypothetical protein